MDSINLNYSTISDDEFDDIPNATALNSSTMSATGSLRMPEFRCTSMSQSTVRDEWTRWVRGTKNMLAAADIIDPLKKKQLLLAWGGLQLLDVFYSIPGADGTDGELDVFETAVDKLTKYFSPKHHDTYERHKFWSLTMQQGETIDRFLHRVRQQANCCDFGDTAKKSRDISIIDKVIASSPSELKEKLLHREHLTLEQLEKTVNSFQAVKQQTKLMTSSNREILVNKLYGKNDNRMKECSRCGFKDHDGNFKNCPALNATCRKCGNRGHYASKCRSVGQKRSNFKAFGSQPQMNKRFKSVRKIEDVEEDNDEEHSVYNIGECDELVWCNVGGTDIEMCIDSGSKHNLIDDKTYEFMKNNDARFANERYDTAKKFMAYGRLPLQLLKVFDAKIKVHDQNHIIEDMATFYVIKHGQQPLLGKETAKSMGLLKIGLPSSQERTVFKTTVKRSTFPKVKGVQIHIPINPHVQPVQQPMRRCPAALEVQLKDKLDELLELDIIEKAPASEWISPLVPILKDNGDLRVCVDMRRANEAILRENHPLPTIDQLLAQLRDACRFTKLDFKNGFHQLELHPSSRHITTFISPWGIFRYKRLLFGINCAPEIFQKIVEQILAGCENVLIFIDDIVVFGKSDQEHDRSLEKVLTALRNKNVLLNTQKCEFKKTEITFLGHKLSKDGVRPTDDKVAAIRKCREPKTKEELRSFLGLVTFLGKFLPDLMTTTFPLRQLLKKNTTFDWNESHRVVFERLKNQVANTRALGYFDVKDRTRVVTDASGVGLGAVLLQFDDKDIPRVIYYASKSLSDCEKRFSTTEKEALGLVWGVERFSMYLLGVEFELETDHRPLVTIFGKRSKPCARIERWVLRLMAFRFKVVYRRGRTNLADALSRLSQSTDNLSFNEDSPIFVRAISEALSKLTTDDFSCTFDPDVEATVRAIHESAALDVHEIEAASEVDDEMKKLREAIDTDMWDDEQLRLYAPFQKEFGYTGSLVVRNTSLVIPKCYRQRMLDLAHEGHPGESSMKSRLRSCCWWPKLDKDVSTYVAKCRGCQWTSLPDRPPEFKPRSLPSKPWTDLALDFLGPLPTGESLLVVVDYFSRYMEVKIVKDQSASTTRDCLDEIFTRLGFPYTLQFDNARQLVSEEVTKYCSENGIAWVNTTPYWPQANGEVERQNRSLMKRLRIGYNMHGDWKSELRAFLKMYYTTPHSITGKPPSELMGRLIRSKLPHLNDLISKPLNAGFRDRDQTKKFLNGKRENESRGAKTSSISVGDTVLMKNLLGGNKFRLNFNPEEFVVEAMNGSHVTIRQKQGDKTFERNVSHLKKIPPSDPDATEAPSVEEDLPSLDQPHVHNQPMEADLPRRPRRAVKVPTHLNDYNLM